MAKQDRLLHLVEEGGIDQLSTVVQRIKSLEVDIAELEQRISDAEQSNGERVELLDADALVKLLPDLRAVLNRDIPLSSG